MKKTTRLTWFPPMLLVIVSVVWGTTFFIVKGTVSEVNEYLLVFMRCIIAALSLFAFLLLRKPKALWNWRTLRDGAILGSLLGCMYTSQTIGLKFTSSGHSAFITGIAIVIVPIVMFIFFKYRFSRQNIAAIVIVTLGLFFLTYDTKTQMNQGDLITLVTALTAALHITFVSRMVHKHDVMSLVAYQFLFSALFNLGIFLMHSPLQFQFSYNAWSSLIYLGFIGTLFCYAASSWAQKYVNPVAAALIFSLEPVFASIFSYFISGEVLNIRELAGASLILAGILYYELPIKRLIQSFKQRFA